MKVIRFRETIKIQFLSISSPNSDVKNIKTAKEPQCPLKSDYYIPYGSRY